MTTPTDNGLPALPEPDGEFCASVRGQLDAYSAEQMHAYALAARDQEAAGLRERAAYWKQRAKAAEGHLWGSDLQDAAQAIHGISVLRETAWADLTDMQRFGFDHAARLVVGTINAKRAAREPKDAALAAKGER